MILGILLFKKYIHSTIVDNIIVDPMNVYNIYIVHIWLRFPYFSIKAAA